MNRLDLPGLVKFGWKPDFAVVSNQFIGNFVQDIGVFFLLIRGRRDILNTVNYVYLYDL